MLTATAAINVFSSFEKGFWNMILRLRHSCTVISSWNIIVLGNTLRFEFMLSVVMKVRDLLGHKRATKRDKRARRFK